MIEEFREAFEKRHERARKRKEEGHKMVGWLCSYTPEEILYAGGIDTIRVLGGTGESLRGDAHLYSNLCSFVRNCLEEGFTHYSFLDGFITCNTCEHIRRLYDVWNQYVKTPFHLILSLPIKDSPEAVAFLTDELMRLKGAIEAHFGVSIGDDDLRRAIKVFNEMRRCLKALNELRKEPRPPLKGWEVMEVTRAALVMPKDEFVTRAKGLLGRLRPVGSQDGEAVRLMVMGSELDDPKFLQEIEEVGGIIVADDLCCGSRYFLDLVAEDAKDPWEALAQRYLSKLPCPRMHLTPMRLERLKAMVETYHVQGVIYQTIKFCGLHAGIYPVIKNFFQRLGLPMLRVEREYLFSGSGQLRTRVEAFLESIKEQGDEHT